MGFSHHYTHTCTIVSYTVGQSARGAQTKTASGTQTLVKCRFVHPKQPDSEPLPELGQMIRTDAYLFLNPSISVDTEAEISNVRWKSDGALVDAGPFEVIEVAKRNRRNYHHMRLRLKKLE